MSVGNGTLPHQREILWLHDIVEDCHAGRNKLVVVICDTAQVYHYVQQIVRAYSTHHFPEVAIYRDSIVFGNGARLLFMNKSQQVALRGMTPERIVLVGPDAEFWHLIMATGAKIEAVA